jgi:hypothetical protein
MSNLEGKTLVCFFTDPNWKDCWEGEHVDLSSIDVAFTSRPITVH